MNRNDNVLAHFAGTTLMLLMGLLLGLASAIAGTTDVVNDLDVEGLAGVAIFCLLVAAPAMALVEHGWRRESEHDGHLRRPHSQR